MADMKEYLVTLSDENFIVLAKNAKEAIEHVWNTDIRNRNDVAVLENLKVGYASNHIYAKSELKARSLGSLHNEEGRIIYLW